ncbi:protein COFACTOR ASSEMBLY OF COMPLEX C SUBUNIT B CCB4, chloroplastic isoform X2 [Ricinus communis]|uniref:protein COFACTOR ASSEMBLY OF COMPLEX C SUBUNIT B CCB4, chloroplastic isoform X2 n=1 Tax=Ricinus communis TaxID=3988 RepID=UPI000D69C1D1|nr:protein COFACTOR ASSEMBLY OF COMPLEX C SUBUNIT B CCB4, chloroplastic isoform X2 [Ricinus communis]|eukprot:XP_025013284.1 protein COFACTOR ASSEMBLY OF COMPLEX C SUBUNIT B CCB4, chloroplastic isoform X2 [Ricinus communis]
MQSRSSIPTGECAQIHLLYICEPFKKLQNGKQKQRKHSISMEAGTILPTSILFRSPFHFPISRPLQNLRFFVRASSDLNSQGKYRGPKPKRDLVADWVSNNDDTVRSLPIYVGGASLLAVLFNRAASGIAPVADASSSQSRADLLTLGLAVTNILAGLIWLSIKPKSISLVNPQGVECQIILSHLPDYVVSELLWAWESLSAATCCRSLVVVYDCVCFLQIGMAAESPNKGEALSVDAAKLMQGSLVQAIKKSGAQSYLANLSLYPGRTELPFLPLNTQPLGDKGVAIIGGDTIRGFTTSDQAWITFIGEKLDSTLAKCVISSPLAMQDRI